ERGGAALGTKVLRVHGNPQSEATAQGRPRIASWQRGEKLRLQCNRPAKGRQKLRSAASVRGFGRLSQSGVRTSRAAACMGKDEGPVTDSVLRQHLHLCSIESAIPLQTLWHDPGDMHRDQALRSGEALIAHEGSAALAKGLASGAAQ